MTPRASALCTTLRIRYPIVQSGMSRVAGPELVAAVSNAGGLGILAALRLEPDELRVQIRRIRAMTDAPFGVNLWLHPAVVSPMRTLRNKFTSEYANAPVLPPMLQSSAADDIFKAAAQRGDAQYFPMPAGESAGLIADMPSAADVVATMVREADEVVRSFTPVD